MRRIRNFLFFAGVVLIIGPSIGFTIRGLGSLSTGESAIAGVVAIGIGIVLHIINRNEEQQELERKKAELIKKLELMKEQQLKEQQMSEQEGL